MPIENKDGTGASSRASSLTRWWNGISVQLHLMNNWLPLQYTKIAVWIALEGPTARVATCRCCSLDSCLTCRSRVARAVDGVFSIGESVGQMRELLDAEEILQ